MHRAAFLDRDGVINRKAPEGEYITNWESLEILPGVSAGIAELRRQGYQIIVISNQRCVAKGIVTVAELEALHGRLQSALSADGADIDAIYYCPHDYESKCECRKPNPGMLLRAASDHQIDLSDSWMIGDSEIDIQAGKRAGCRTILITDSNESAQSLPDIKARSLLDASRLVSTQAGGGAKCDSRPQAGDE